jgi:hypothetical protein
MVDQHQVSLRANAPAGEYTLNAGLWLRESGERARVLDGQGRPGEAGHVRLRIIRVQP